MKRLVTWCGAILAVLSLANSTHASFGIASGQIKGVDVDKKEILLTDADGKDWKFKLSDKVIMNRGGRESQSDLATGDSVSVHYEKGVISSTADYVLVREAESKNWELVDGKIKSYEVNKNLLTLTNENGRDTVYMARDAKASLNNKACRFNELKIGEYVLAIVAKDAGKTSLKAVMCDRK